MGVTIHYRGRLRRKEELQTLSAKVADLCKSAHWKYQPWVGMDELKPLQGISFRTHPESEFIWMTFDKASLKT